MLTKDGPLKDLSVRTLPVYEAEQPLELVYIDVFGPFSMQASGGY